MFEYKLVKVPFVDSHSINKESQPINIMTHKIEKTIDQERQDGWQFVKIATSSCGSTRLKNCYELIFRKHKN